MSVLNQDSEFYGQKRWQPEIFGSKHAMTTPINFQVKTCADKTKSCTFSSQGAPSQARAKTSLCWRCVAGRDMFWSGKKERAPTRLVHEGRDAATRFTSDTRDTSVVTDKMAPPRTHLTTINGGRRDVLSTDNQDRNG